MIRIRLKKNVVLTIIVVLTALGVGLCVGSLGSPPQERYQRYEDVQNDLKTIGLGRPERAKAPQYREPCVEPKGREDSDLCAQWKSVGAAESSTYWAKFAALIGMFSALGIVVALGLTVYANWIARRIGEAQVRCYLSAKDVKFSINGQGQPRISMTLINSGQSPAIDFRWAFQVNVSNLTPHEGWQWACQALIPGGGRDIFAQREDVRSLTIINDQVMPQGQLSDLLLNPQLRITVRIITAWQDVFSEEFAENWRFEASCAGAIDTDLALFPDIPAKD
jgi:hypothetical protein